jgi:cytochrome P450
VTALRPPHVRAGLAFRRDPLRFLRARENGAGPIRFRAGLSEFTVLRDPDTIHRVLVSEADRFGEGKWTLRGRRVMGDCLITREGTPHRHRRGLLGPAFERRRLVERVPAMVDRVTRVVDGWRDGETLDVRAQMSAIALTASAEALFSLDLDQQAPAIVPALQTMLHEIPRPGVPWPAGRRLAAARRAVRAGVEDAIVEGGDGEDVLSALRAAGLDDEQVSDEVVSLLIASVDTTPGTLAFAWQLLGTHPAHEAQVHAELDEVLSGRTPAAEDLARLGHLDRVLSEVLRLHPPVHFIDRRPLADVELEGSPVAAGSFLLLSPLLTHRDPRLYPEPDAFRPERFTPEGRASRPRFAYFPFGAGPHACIGMSLARLELVLVMATVAARVRLVPTADPGTMTVARR